MFIVFQEDKYVSCEIAEENKVAVGLDCSVGNLYIPPFTKVNIWDFKSERIPVCRHILLEYKHVSFLQLNITFLLDMMQNSSAGDLGISINATRYYKRSQTEGTLYKR